MSFREQDPPEGERGHVLASAEAETARRHRRRAFLRGEATPQVSVVIPARNEAASLPWLLERIPAGIHEVILVDGHSTDGTVDIAREFYPTVRVLTQRAAGKGSALVTGLLAATGDIVVMIDADGSMDPIEIHGLVGALLSGADVVKSSRYAAGGGSSDISLLRSAGNLGLNLAAKALFRHDWSELCYGLAAFWADILPILDLEQIVTGGDPDDRTAYGRGFEIETLLFTRALRSGLRVAEVPSFEYARRYGESNLSTFRDGWRVLAAIARERARGHHQPAVPSPRPVMIVGAGTVFLSGISHYTHHLASAMADAEPTAVILMRRLVPKALYPGRARIGASLSDIAYPPDIPVFDGIDWNKPRSVAKAIRFIKQTRPRVVVLQWWTAAVGYQYVRLAAAAHRVGARVIVEFQHRPRATEFVDFHVQRILTEGHELTISVDRPFTLPIGVARGKDPDSGEFLVQIADDRVIRYPRELAEAAEYLSTPHDALEAEGFVADGDPNLPALRDLADQGHVLLLPGGHALEALDGMAVLPEWDELDLQWKNSVGVKVAGGGTVTIRRDTALAIVASGESGVSIGTLLRANHPEHADNVAALFMMDLIRLSEARGCFIAIPTER